jgi:hypothetical protein
MTANEQRAGSWYWWGLLAFATVLSTEVIWYPQLASFVTRVILKQGDAGSGIIYYRDFYVLPGALAFGIVVGVWAVAVSKRPRRLIRVLWGAWGVDLILLGFSLWLYLTKTAAAERYRGV